VVVRPLLVGIIALTAGLTSCGAGNPTGAPRAAASGPASGAAVRFLARYVESDGRVIRHDQGGDITSEGQAYAMLIAESAGRTAVVRTVWSWTSAHLQRADGLFAWHATGDGRIEDPQSATDADILIAYALLRSAGPGSLRLHDDGRRIAAAVLAHESVRLADGTLLPAAGPWATTTSPPTLNPSYLMPGVFDALAALTGDGRWRAAARAAVALVGHLTDGGRRLPPDWAVLAGGRLVAAPQPGGGAGVRYSLDAARLPVWFATACDRDARTMAARWWRAVLGRADRSAALALDLDGSTLAPGATPLTLLAGAAAATAAGDRLTARALGRRAQALARDTPTYYGDAWAALGPALIGGAIDPCAAGG
jgi:endoglucanase